MAGPAVLRFSKGLPATKQFGERLRLLVRQGQDQGTCYSLLGDQMYVGREGCQITLNDGSLSRKHAEIVWAGGHYQIRDLGSSNGIVHNGTKAKEAALNPGDIVLIGLTVLEVYPAGHTRKTDKPMLAAPAQFTAAPAAAAAPANIPGLVNPADRKKVESKRLILIGVVGFLLFAAYLSDDKSTVREKMKVQLAEDIDTPAEQAGKPVAVNSQAKIDKIGKQIVQMKTQLAEAQKARAKAEQEARTAKSLSSDALPDQMASAADRNQRKDAEIFFRNGGRELQNRNFRRAFTAFETALTVDPTHELAKIYLKSARMELLSELWSTQVAGLKAKASLRYKESRMHFENIVRYLEVESGASTLQNEENKDLKELLAEAKKELEELDRLESKNK